MRKSALVIIAAGSVLAGSTLAQANDGWKCKRPSKLNWMEKFICFSDPLPGPEHESGDERARRDFGSDYRPSNPGGGGSGLPGGNAGNAGNAGGLGVGDSGHILARFLNDLIRPGSAGPEKP